MMKLSVVHVKDTKNYVCYETPNWETLFRAGLYGVKIWIPKKEFGHESIMTDTYPEVIEVGILDDSDRYNNDGGKPQELTLNEIIRRSRA